VEAFEKHQSPVRLRRLINYLDLRDTYTVADFGCGNGMLMEHVAPRVNTYVGVDFSEPFIEAARSRKRQLGIKNARFVHCTIEEFCQAHKEEFDVGFAMDLSEHVYDGPWIGILRSISAALKKSGRLYLHTPNADFFLEIMRKHDFIVKHLPEHVAVRTAEHNARLLQEAGFTVKKLRLIAPYTVLKYVHPLSFVPFIGKYCKARIFIEAVK